MPDPSKPCSSDPMGLNCKHMKTKWGHCNVVLCGNYWGDCPRHASDGTRGN